MEKYVRDGKVAVLVTPNHGGGWYTWNTDMPELLFDPTLVDLVLNSDNERIKAYTELKYPDAYTGGLKDLVVQWVPEGARFRINEYDGSESIVLESEEDWFVA